MIGSQTSEVDALKRDARSSVGKSFDERTAMFLSLMELVDATLSQLPAEERQRRRDIAGQLDPRPTPWWLHFLPEALADNAEAH
jgi:hypothetical protein